MTWRRRMDEQTLHGKKVFITGCASGIGYAQAEMLLQQGAYVFGLDIESSGLQTLKSQYGHFSSYEGSVANKKDVQQTVQLAREKYNTIEVLLNTAGILDAYKTRLATDEELWDQIFTTNIKGMYYVTNEILPLMLRNGSGVIINMASIAGLV